MPQSVKHLLYVFVFNCFFYFTEVPIDKFFSFVIMKSIQITSYARCFKFYYRIYRFRY